MLTEEEARKKWCPYSRFVIDSEHYASGNRFQGEKGETRSGDFDKRCNCIASACMAWRPVETDEFKRRADAEFMKTGKHLVADTGFCGLAGRPE